MMKAPPLFPLLVPFSASKNDLSPSISVPSLSKQYCPSVVGSSQSFILHPRAENGLGLHLDRLSCTWRGAFWPIGRGALRRALAKAGRNATKMYGQDLSFFFSRLVATQPGGMRVCGAASGRCTGRHLMGARGAWDAWAAPQAHGGALTMRFVPTFGQLIQ